MRAQYSSIAICESLKYPTFRIEKMNYDLVASSCVGPHENGIGLKWLPGRKIPPLMACERDEKYVNKTLFSHAFPVGLAFGVPIVSRSLVNTVGIDNFLSSGYLGEIYYEGKLIDSWYSFNANRVLQAAELLSGAAPMLKGELCLSPELYLIMSKDMFDVVQSELGWASRGQMFYVPDGSELRKTNLNKLAR